MQGVHMAAYTWYMDRAKTRPRRSEWYWALTSKPTPRWLDRGAGGVHSLHAYLCVAGLVRGRNIDGPPSP